jgi:FkbM family methyltransferase
MKTTVKLLIRSALKSLGYEIQPVSNRAEIYTRHGLNILLPAATLLYKTKNEPLKILQVGANDGLSEDSISSIIPAIPCRAILVEPHPYAFRALQARHSNSKGIILEQTAISKEKRILQFFMSSNPVHSEITSTRRAHVERHIKTHNARRSEEAPAEVTSFTIESTTIFAILEKHGFQNLDILACDAEGMDFEIITSALDKNFRAEIFHFEVVNMTKSEMREIVSRLRDAGYVLAQSGRDLLAVRKSQADRMLARLPHI